MHRCVFCGYPTNYFDWRLGVYICVRCKAIYDSIVNSKPTPPKKPLKLPVYDDSTASPKYYFKEASDATYEIYFPL